MRDHIVILILLLIIFSCKKPEPDNFFPSEIDIVKNEVSASFDGLNNSMSYVITSFNSRQPVLSDAFIIVEGSLACVDIYPIVINGELAGAISSLIVLGEILGDVILPVVENQSFEIWVMDKNGLVIYDQDVEEIGLNILTDPLYADFPELITACKKIADEDSGDTYYSFYQTGTTNVITKKTYWNTYKYHSKEWKIVWVKKV